MILALIFGSHYFYHLWRRPFIACISCKLSIGNLVGKSFFFFLYTLSSIADKMVSLREVTDVSVTALVWSLGFRELRWFENLNKLIILLACRGDGLIGSHWNSNNTGL